MDELMFDINSTEFSNRHYYPSVGINQNEGYVCFFQQVRKETKSFKKKMWLD